MRTSSSTTSRRNFIRTVGTGFAALTLAKALPSFPRAAQPSGPRSLVLIQLEGGNDGFNTLVPLHDRDYYTQRPTLALARRELIPVSELFALNHAMAPLLPLFNDGKLTIIPRVGYPLVSDSHHRSTEIWHTASTEEFAPETGWAGRALSALAEKSHATKAIHGSRFAPRILSGAPATEQLVSTGQNFEIQLQEIGERIAAADVSEVYFVTLSGFDTHFDQANRHKTRLSTLATALAHFQKRLAQRGAAPRVTTMAFSEFGRSLSENYQGGTHHGPTLPAFLLGDGLKGGIHQESRETMTDFRQLVATLSHDWLGAASFENAFTPLDLLSGSPEV